MAADLVNSATSDKLKEMDWMKNIEVCELVIRDPGQAREVIKAVKKRLGNKSSNTQLWAVNLLEMLMNNCGEHIHSQVIDIGLLPIMVKIVKKKSDLPVREKIFLLLDAMQTSLGGVSGKFPQYYNAYFELVNAGVKFPRAPNVVPSELPISKVHKSKLSEAKPVSPKADGNLQQRSTQNRNHQERIENGNHQQRSSHTLPESSIIQKAGAALEVLRDVLDAIDTQNPEAAKDEFTLDLVEQCSFQKQRVMHIVMTSRDERLVSQAIELNELLDKVLTRHDVLLSVRAASPIHFDLEEVEKEEAELLSLRIRKGKACMRSEDEELPRPLGLLGATQPERLHRPLVRPLCIEPKDSVAPLPKNSVAPLPKDSIAPQPKNPIAPQPKNPIAPLPKDSTVPKESSLPGTVIIPPPPAKHVEREKFFQEKRVDGSTIEGNMRGLQLHSRNASSSNSGSMDSGD